MLLGASSWATAAPDVVIEEVDIDLDVERSIESDADHGVALTNVAGVQTHNGGSANIEEFTVDVSINEVLNRADHGESYVNVAGAQVLNGAEIDVGKFAAGVSIDGRIRANSTRGISLLNAGGVQASGRE